MKELNLEVFKLANMHLESGEPMPKKIKITSEFYEYLAVVCQTTFESASNRAGVYGQFTGIPIEIDDTIENEYYELVYEDDKK